MQNTRYYIYIAVAFVVTLLVSNTVATKIVQLGPFTVAGAIFIFPLSYIFGDILTEIYGYKIAKKTIWLGFGALIIMSFFYWLVGVLPAASFWANQTAYDAILGLVPRIVLGSILGYLVGEFCNSFVLSKLKIITHGKHLWMRTVSSTVVGQAVDSIVFVLIAFGGIFAINELIGAIVSGYVLKVAIEVICTPLTYLVVNKLKKTEKIDVYDYEVNYNPFF